MAFLDSTNSDFLNIKQLSEMSRDELIEYFFAPKQTGYDPTKTMVFAAVLIGAVLAIYKILQKLKVAFDWRLAFAISPYVVLGSVIRVLEDMTLIDIYPYNYLFVTPGIYIFVFLMAFATLLVSLFVERRYGIDYFKIMFMVGVLMLPIPIAHIHFNNLYGAALVVIFWVPWLLVLRFVKWSDENKIATVLQMFDANATFVALQFFDFYEQHVVPTFFIDIFGPFVFVALKIAAMVVALTAIDRLSDDEEFNFYIKMIIALLGAATGGRDFLTLLSLG